jgi:DNA-binding SARP family transcriptional activator
MENKPETNIKVQMFGTFAVYYNGEVVLTENSRNNKVIFLLQYLLVRHGQYVKQSELMNKLRIDEEEHFDPAHTLKNLVYRLRKLIEASDLPNFEYITYKKSSYCFNSPFTMTSDYQEFDHLLQLINSPTTTEDERLSYGLQAISLYGGDFLSHSNNMPWVIAKSVHYQEKYLECISAVFDIYRHHNKLSLMNEIFETAIAFYPYDEHLRYLHITSLFLQHHYREAMNEYDFFNTLLLDEMGVSPSNEMLELFKEITSAMNLNATSIDLVRDEMAEPLKEHGALYCNYQYFVNTYRFVVRHAERSGGLAYLSLFTFNDVSKNSNNMESRRKEVTSSFHKAMKIALRRGDIYARYSSNQFIVLLMDINYENTKIVINRITEEFFHQLNSRNVRLTSQVISGIDINRIINK